MDDKKAVELARKIAALDIQRDKMWEELAKAAGNRAYEILRHIQNSTA
ncbi:hypothetical protein [Peribacillus sp. SCS-37]